MARLIQAWTPEEVKKVGVAAVREGYNKLARDYNKILDGKLFYCHCCNEFHPSESFYNDKRYASGLFPECKKALLHEATDYDKKTKTYTDNKEKTIKVFQKMNLPFIDSLYQTAITNTQIEEGEKNRQTAYQHMLTMVKSLPQYHKLTFDDSEFGDDTEIYKEETTKRIRKETKRMFGDGFSLSDLAFLQQQYDDWKARTQIDSKSQETYVVQICYKQLDIWKAQKEGRDTDKLVKSLNDLMNGANLQPRQNVGNAATDSLTFGQLIEKWEQEKPIPEPDEDFKDVNNIGKLLRVYFSGHLAKALGLNTAYSKEYEEEMEKYTVHKPEAASEDNSSAIYNQLFGQETE